MGKDKTGLIIQASLLLARRLYGKEFLSGEIPGEPKPPPPPPWVNAKYNIPKSRRKGKTWEEIAEIKKQIWMRQRVLNETAHSD